jgi:hypothetical protein
MERPANPKRAKSKRANPAAERSRAMPQSSTQKNPVHVLAELVGPPGGTQPNVTLNAATQASILTLVLNQKINALMTARDRFVQLLQHNPPSLMTLTAANQGIDAEVNLCIMILNALANNTPIQFPSPQQMSALSAAVQALGTATAQGAATTALITAVANVIATFPG